MYLGVSFAALALFGDGVHADVLLDFARDAAVDQIGVKGLYVAQLALTYPVLFCVMREVLLELFRGDEGDETHEQKRSFETTVRNAVEHPRDSFDGDRDDDLERRLLDGEETAGRSETRGEAVGVPYSGVVPSAYDTVDRWTHVAVTLGLIGAQFFVAMSTPESTSRWRFSGVRCPCLWPSSRRRRWRSAGARGGGRRGKRGACWGWGDAWRWRDSRPPRGTSSRHRGDKVGSQK